jgi:hypothetical protein
VGVDVLYRRTIRTSCILPVKSFSKRKGILFTPNKVDQDQIQRTGCVCKSCVHLSLYISRMQAIYADVLDKEVLTKYVTVMLLIVLAEAALR